MKKKSSLYTIIFYACMLVVIVVAVAALFMGNKTEEEPVYSDIIGHFEENNVKSFVVNNNVITVNVIQDDGTEKEVTYVLRDINIFYNDFMRLKEVMVDTDGDGIEDAKLLSNLEKYDFPPVKERSWFITYLPTILLCGGAIILFIFLTLRGSCFR